jgi:FAD synthase
VLLKFTSLVNLKKKREKIKENNVLFVCLMVFNATFNNISVISLRSVVLVEETGGHSENHRPVASR